MIPSMCRTCAQCYRRKMRMTEILMRLVNRSHFYDVPIVTLWSVFEIRNALFELEFDWIALNTSWKKIMVV